MKKKGVSPSPMDDNLVDIINDSLFPFFRELTPRKAADLAVSTTEQIDSEVEQLSPDFVKAISALGDRHALKRSIYRKMHLDEIEILLKKNCNKKN